LLLGELLADERGRPDHVRRRGNIHRTKAWKEDRKGGRAQQKVGLARSLKSSSMTAEKMMSGGVCGAIYHLGFSQ
jgi:hypothetical protein